MIAIVIILIVLVYLISTFGMYKYFQKLYSKNGIYEGIEPHGMDLFLTFCPVYNTILNFLWIASYPVKLDYKKFFRIK